MLCQRRKKYVSTIVTELLRSCNSAVNKRVGFIGKRGTGKTTLINSILQKDILPISGIGACAAVCTEINYYDGEDYLLIVDFLTKEQWLCQCREFDMELLKSSSDNPDRKAAEKAEQRMKALYGFLPEGEQLETKIPKDVSNRLGTTIYIPCKGDQLSEELRVYTADNFFWPIVKQIIIRAPLDPLKNGVTICDLPGTFDGNVALEDIARSHEESCDFVVYVEEMLNAKTETTRELVRKKLLPSPERCCLVLTKVDAVTDKDASNFSPPLPKSSKKEEVWKHVVEAFPKELLEYAKGVVPQDLELIKIFPVAAERCLDVELGKEES